MMLRFYMFPLLGWPTRKQIEAGLGHDRVKLDTFAFWCWRLFRATVVGSLVAWLILTAVLVAFWQSSLFDTDDWRQLTRLAAVATGLFGTAVLVNYPWPFRDQGRRWVRWAVIAVGVPSVAIVLWLLFAGS